MMSLPQQLERNDENGGIDLDRLLSGSKPDEDSSNLYFSMLSPNASLPTTFGAPVSTAFKSTPDPELASASSIRPVLSLSEAAEYTIVALDGMSPTTKPKTYLFDIAKGNEYLSPCDHHRYPLAPPPIQSPSGKTILTRPTSLVLKDTSAGKIERVVNEKAANSIAMRGDNRFYRWQRIARSHRKSMFNYLLPLCLLLGVLVLIYSFRDTAKHALFWVEMQNEWIIFVIFLCMFTIVSFPVTVGYLVLIIASGYLFGFLRGLLTVVIGANLGVAIAHNTLKLLQSKLPVHKLIKNETGRAILRVISGPRAFKIVLFARLTPIPFGLQNTIFGISAVNTRSYHAGTLLGLLPAQTINVYLGSKLRSIHEVLNDHNAALGLAGYGVFVVEVVVGAALMVWVIQKARMELSAALLATEADSDEKILIEIEA
ncbi:transmembrane protein 64 [Anopheles darlingi]|uniref:transmembrane protein 64 n=1 Tax=Anopheles darlingi TaxID=43151 RepID=UPI00210029EB|nr:transmembrane protein 64 [Anopheles darlingi]XP_049543816.1 transmembrane protein 64 [Anopheles darlingi]XP_049543817.1 transmembrane protein 64 [Anopheles darlingi]XP_049543818.1 transmembrane protein 64 [Anopheles darlingi]XP_049543819.1 transmembrane protein 64 [Anopheles darlingi]